MLLSVCLPMKTHPHPAKPVTIHFIGTVGGGFAIGTNHNRALTARRGGDGVMAGAQAVG